MSKYVSNAKADAATKEVLAKVDYDRWGARETLDTVRRACEPRTIRVKPKKWWQWWK